LGLKKPGMPASRVDQRGVGEPRPVHQTPEFLALHPAPEFLQPVEAILGLIAGDQAGVDGADRRADDPIRLDPGFVERLIDTRLVSAERAAALEHEHDLESPRWIGFRCRPFLCIRNVPGFRDIQHLCLRYCARVELVRCDPADSVLADPNVRSNRHLPAMPCLQPRQRRKFGRLTRAKFDGCVTSLPARFCLKLPKRWNQVHEPAFTCP